MAKTLIQLCNDVGKRMRRSTGSTYTSLTQNADVIFIVEALNEAKRMVEDSWKWDVLTKEILFPTVQGTRTYDTSSLSVVTSDPTVTTERSYIKKTKDGRIQMWDITSGAEFRMVGKSREYAEAQTRLSTAQSAIPGAVAIYQNGTGLTVHFVDVPASARPYSMSCIVPQDDLVATATVIQVPWRPVVLAAVALAAEERGEELGLDASRWWDQYENAFGSAIGQDATEEDMTLIAETYNFFDNGLSL